MIQTEKMPLITFREKDFIFRLDFALKVFETKNVKLFSDLKGLGSQSTLDKLEKEKIESSKIGKFTMANQANFKIE